MPWPSRFWVNAFAFLLKADGVNYVGVWTIDGEQRVGKEMWIPQ
jgi:hypothetical protein